MSPLIAVSNLVKIVSSMLLAVWRIFLAATTRRGAEKLGAGRRGTKRPCTKNRKKPLTGFRLPVGPLALLLFVLASMGIPAAPTSAGFTQSVVNESGTVTVYFDATWDSKYVDIHYSLKGAPQQNFRMAKSGNRWSHRIPNAKAGDVLGYWFTYEKNGPQFDSPVYTKVIPGRSAPTPIPTPVPTPTPTPVPKPTPVPGNDFTHNVENVNGSVTVYFDATWDSKYVDIHYSLKNAPQQNFRMAKSGNRWSHRIPNAKAGDVLGYWFTYEKNGPQFDSPVYTKVIPGASAPTSTPVPTPTPTPTPTPVPVPTPAPPAVPKGLTATPNGMDQITIKWDSVPDAVGYDLKIDGVTLPDASSPVMHGPLAPSSTHTYAVRSKNAEGVSTYSANVSATTDGPPGEIVPLFSEGVTLEPPTVIETDTALITRIGDRGRDRHARESQFKAYDHYLSWYWEHRTVGIEIVDRVAKGGNSITFNITSLWKLDAPDFRAFFRGIGTVAEYWHNADATAIDDFHYTTTVSYNAKEGRPIRVGDRMEIEFSPFLVNPPNGRSNYYGTAMLYIVGQGGTVPWESKGPLLDSYPLPKKAWLGGRTTLPYQYSDEPTHRLKQLATNISPETVQPFMLGRRLHHTDFGDGSHSEPNNPVFNEQIGKLGTRFTARSCVECHSNNGRTLPPPLGISLKAVVQVGTDAAGTAHPNLGKVLQPQSTSGSPEGGVSIGSWTTTAGTFGDGTPFELRKPNYSFTGITPEYYSVRFGPALVGLGLLEAIDEKTIQDLADPDDADGDGISGRIQSVKDPQSGQLRLGRFGWKAGQARLKHQIASALNQDLGVTTAIDPTLDRGSAQEGTDSPAELSDADLDNLSRYLATLGVPARRNLEDPVALRGERLFASMSCVKCHSPAMTTSPYHPMTELRDQPIQAYTDLLLHDMGTGLADNMGEDKASGAEWRTPPLWGIGSTAEVSGGEAYLHDGRARNLTEAILWHGGEAQASQEAFRQLPSDDRAAVIKFLQSL